MGLHGFSEEQITIVQQLSLFTWSTQGWSFYIKKTAMVHDHLLFTCGKQEKQIVLEIKKGNTDRSVVPWEEGEALSPFLFLSLFLPDLAISKRACLQASGESKIIFIISDSLDSLG